MSSENDDETNVSPKDTSVMDKNVARLADCSLNLLMLTYFSSFLSRRPGDTIEIGSIMSAIPIEVFYIAPFKVVDALSDYNGFFPPLTKLARP